MLKRRCRARIRRVRSSTRAVAVWAVLAALAGCANWPADNDAPAEAGDLLESSLPVAAAALAAGQLGVARRLYLSLSERFDDAPEPFLGLGHIALESGDFAAAERDFRKAAERAGQRPALRAEALLGAGRSALARDLPGPAARYFRDAWTPAQGTPIAAWTANGRAVAATLGGDHEAAETHYVEALRLSADDPRIVSNYLRMLVAAERPGDAGRTFERFPPAHWPGDEHAVLSRLIADARRRAPASGGMGDASGSGAGSSRPPETGLPDSGPRGSGLDREQVMWLHLSDGRPAPQDADPGSDADAIESGSSVDRTGLGLRLGRADPGPPSAAEQDAAPPPVEASSGSGAPPPARAGSSSRPAAADADPAARSAAANVDLATSPAQSPLAPDRADASLPGTSAAHEAQSPLAPDRAAGESGSKATGSDTVASQPAPGPRTEAPPATGAPASDPAARRSALATPESAAPGSTASGSAASGFAAPGSATTGLTSSPSELAPGATDLESPDPASPPALTLILGQSRRIHLERDATTVLVAAPEVADVQLLAPDVLYVIGKGIGRTSVTVLHDDERIEERVIAVALDLEPLRSVLAGESDLTAVRARRLSRGIALTGEVASAASVDRALRLAAGALPEGVPIENEVRVAAPQQVNLEVQIAEVHRSVTEDLGVNWELFRVRSGGDGAVGFRIGRIIDEFPPTEFEGRLASSVRFERIGSHSRLGAMVDALATAGLANVLARPNVTAVSGESASFFSGGERPIPSGYDADTRTILFEYKKVGVLLDFVPTVVDSGRIVLTVRPEVSEPDASQPLVIGPVQLPIINVRRAETTVEVGDGESIVIAGLFRNQSSTTEAGLPGLKDVPLLGLLFGTTSVRSNELELIVIVTARLVRPNAAPGETDPPPETLRVSGYHY